MATALTWPGAPAGAIRPRGIKFTQPSTAQLSYIGPLASTEWIAGIPEYDKPFDADPKEYIIRVPYKVRADKFTSLPIDREGPYGGYHAGESNRRDLDHGITGFTREFALVPDTRSEYESIIYPYQLVTVDAGTASIIELPVTVASRVQYDYFRTNNPNTIDLPRAPRAIVINGVAYYLNGWDKLVLGNEMLADDAVLRVWRGRIYERIQRFVEVRSLVDEVTA